MTKASNILITAPSWVGDIVMATPAFRCIRENFPKSKVTLLLRPYVSGVIEGLPWFDEIIEYDPKVKHKQARNYLSFIKKLRKERFDLGFFLAISFSSALIPWLAGVKKRVGYVRDARSWLLTHGVERLKEKGRFRPSYMADYYLRLCTSIGCKVGSKKLEVFVSPKDLAKIDELFSKHKIANSKPKFLINPGASFGSSKFWTIEGFARTAELLHQHLDCHVILATAPEEKNLARDIEKVAKGNIINFSEEGIGLDLLKALVERSSMLITVDSGPRHFAVALKKPVVVLMGPTDPRYTQTSQELGKVLREKVECSPCHLKVCPKDHQCMRRIRPEKVAEACRELINQYGCPS